MSRADASPRTERASAVPSQLAPLAPGQGRPDGALGAASVCPVATCDDVAVAKVFISYAREDRAFRDDLVVALESRGVEAWVDEEDIVDGLSLGVVMIVVM